jgi:RNA methyltransferase, TrmH family
MEKICMLRQLKWYKNLSECKCRIDEGYFLIEGKKSIDQIFARTPHSIEELLVDKGYGFDVQDYQIPVRVLESHQLQSISSVKTPQGIIALVKIPEDTYCGTLPENCGDKVLLLENVQDPGNVGTLIRTAAAFRYSGIILSSQSADPFSSKVVQATSGSLFSVWIRRSDNYLSSIQNLKEKGHRVFIADVYGDPHVDFKCCKQQVLALGNEGSGLTKEMTDMADICFSIPIESSHAESLNVAVSGGIAMFASANGVCW